MIDNILFSWRFHQKCTALLLALVVTVLVLVFGTLPNINLFWRELQNTGHTLLFIPVVIFVLSLLRYSANYLYQKPFKLYLTATSISLLIGVAIELIQFVIDRDASTMDVIRDLAGVLTGLGLYASVDPVLQSHKQKYGKQIRAGMTTLSFIILSAGLLPLVLLSATYIQREMALPVVVDLSTTWARPFLQLKNASTRLSNNDETRAFEEDRLTRVDLKRGTYSGFSIIETFPDWSAYQTLKVVVYSKLDHPFKLVLRIHDTHHNYDYTDRFNMEFTINKGTNSLRIPLADIKNAPADREMDMTHIKDLTFFSAQPAEGLYFYVGDIRLE